MPLVAAAVCPQPPLLIPGVAAGAAQELDGCRAACHEAVDALIGSDLDLLIVAGPGSAARAYGSGDWGSLAAFGCPDIAVDLDGRGTGPPTLPLSLTVGAWLLGDGYDGPRLALEIDSEASQRSCADIGRSFATAVRRLGLLVMGDGSACRSERAPGHLDLAAEPADRLVAAALERADPAALSSISPAAAASLQMAGRCTWQVLAGAGTVAREGLNGRLLYHEAPYGVGYLVAAWTTVAR